MLISIKKLKIYSLLWSLDFCSSNFIIKRKAGFCATSTECSAHTPKKLVISFFFQIIVVFLAFCDYKS